MEVKMENPDSDPSCLQCSSHEETISNLHKIIQEIQTQVNGFEVASRASPDSVSSAIYFIQNIDMILVKHDMKLRPMELPKQEPFGQGEYEVEKVDSPRPVKKRKRNESHPIPKVSIVAVKKERKNLRREFQLPIGAKGCLNGLTFVMTGTLTGVRDDIVSSIKMYGGQVVLGGKADFLITGTNPGQLKLQEARRLGTPQLTEEQFLDMIRNSVGEVTY